MIEIETRLAELHAEKAVIQAKIEELERLTMDTTGQHGERRKTNADVAVQALVQLNGKAHGKQILEEVQKVRPVKGDHPMTALAAAMRRDPRIQKDSRKRNYWRLAESQDVLTAQ